MRPSPRPPACLRPPPLHQRCFRPSGSSCISLRMRCLCQLWGRGSRSTAGRHDMALISDAVDVEALRPDMLAAVSVHQVYAQDATQPLTCVLGPQCRHVSNRGGSPVPGVGVSRVDTDYRQPLEEQMCFTAADASAPYGSTMYPARVLHTSAKNCSRREAMYASLTGGGGRPAAAGQ
jgi:hypothetical protein